MLKNDAYIKELYTDTKRREIELYFAFRGTFFTANKAEILEELKQTTENRYQLDMQLGKMTEIPTLYDKAQREYDELTKGRAAK